jgi:protein-tyrosine phosphatase
MGIKAFSYPISDSDEDAYLDGLFHAAQHLNDLVVEQNHTVYLHDNTGISRAPTLLLSYLCLYVKIRTYDSPADAVKLIQSYSECAYPNFKAV